MKCLWLSWVDPRDGQSGELIYSSNLIRALAGAGAELKVLCLANGGSSERAASAEGPCESSPDGIRWRLVPPQSKKPWASVFSPLPNIAYRAGTRSMARSLRTMLDRGHWDSVVLDGLGSGWALPALLEDRDRRGPRAPRIVYVAHNHEETMRREVARGFRGDRARKIALLADAAKAGALERKVVSAADLVTAITEEDAERFAERRQGQPVVVLSPGYDGRRVYDRRITRVMPRRAVVVGSFHWVAKQMNLEGFLSVADPIFKARGAELHVVGGGDEALFERLRSRMAATTLTGRVDSVWPHLDSARIAIVPEEVGGGFKLKILDYVFNRLPVAAFDQSVAGIPLSNPESMLTFPSFRDLASGVLKAIDDIELLNRLQERAFAACAHRFEWSTRGTDLHNAMRAL